VSRINTIKLSILISLLIGLDRAALSFTAEIQAIESTIESVVGTKVLWSKRDPFCREGLLGAYIPSRDIIIICQFNHNRDYSELVATLKHEGWHAVQAKCNRGRFALTDDQIRAHLQARDRTNLHQYHPREHRAEAEARVVEQIPTSNWMRGVKAYCQNP